MAMFSEHPFFPKNSPCAVQTKKNAGICQSKNNAH